MKKMWYVSMTLRFMLYLPELYADVKRTLVCGSQVKETKLILNKEWCCISQFVAIYKQRDCRLLCEVKTSAKFQVEFTYNKYNNKCLVHTA